jgi:hypothetical protein
MNLPMPLVGGIDTFGNTLATMFDSHSAMIFDSLSMLFIIQIHNESVQNTHSRVVSDYLPQQQRGLNVVIAVVVVPAV